MRLSPHADRVTFWGFLEEYEDVLGHMRTGYVFASLSTREGWVNVREGDGRRLYGRRRCPPELRRGRSYQGRGLFQPLIGEPL